MSNPILTHAKVSHEGSTPSSWMLVLHGVFGMGVNFRSFAKALAARAPEWGFVLCDLRGHGTSLGFAPPHTLDAAAADVAALVASLDVPVRGIAGHSFGGKVALTFLARREARMARAFVLDSVPGARPNAMASEDAGHVLELLESVPPVLESRDQFVDICSRAGLSKPTTEWLAMNVRRVDGAYGLRLELPAIRAMLDDYFQKDLWDVVADPSVTERLDLVVGGASKHYRPADLERARALSDKYPHVHLSILEKAGHWVHVDDPQGLLDVMASALRY